MHTAVSWIKTTGNCRYLDRQSSNIIQTVKEKTHDECAELCIENNNCDAFEANNNKCYLFGNTDGQKHTGNGKRNTVSMCYVKRAGESGTSIPLLPLEQLANMYYFCLIGQVDRLWILVCIRIVICIHSHVPYFKFDEFVRGCFFCRMVSLSSIFELCICSRD